MFENYEISVIDRESEEVVDTVIGDMKVARAVMNGYLYDTFYRVQVTPLGVVV